MTVATTLIAVAILAAISLAIVWALRLEQPWLQPIAILRAVLQLGILTLILHGVFSNAGWVAPFLLVMVVAATWVVARRLALRPRDVPVIAGIIVAATVVPVAVVFLSGAIQLSPRYVLAIGGIVIGGAMTVCTLMGRSLGAAFVHERDANRGLACTGRHPTHGVGPLREGGGIDRAHPGHR